MERLIKNAVLYGALTSISVISMMFFSSFTQASGPDFSRLTDHSFNLSGARLKFSLPGRLDRDFPVEEGIYKINIYDNSNYNEGNYYDAVLLNRFWGYKGPVLRNFRQRYANVGLHMNLGKVDSDINLLEDILQLEELNKLTPKDYEIINIGNSPILKVYPPNKGGHAERLSKSKDIDYFIAIDEQYFVVLSFTYLKSSGGDYMPVSWQEKIESDIKRIIDSVEIEYAPSVQERIDSMAVQ
ncbi:MAG: hypothetical protein K6L73_12980 [Cellvibrionaceae bacterium]